MATLTYLTGFEHAQSILGSTGGGVGVVVGSPAVTASGAIAGNADVVFDQNEIWELAIDSNVNVASFKWKPTSFGTGKTALCYAQASGLGMVLYYDSADGKTHAVEITAVGPPFTVTGTPADGSTSISSGTTYQVDVRFLMNGTTWTCDWQINGVAQATLTRTSKSNQPTASLGLGNWAVGSAPTGTYTFRHDDFCLSNTSGDYPIGARDVIGFTIDQTAAAEHQGTLSGWEYADTDGGAATSITVTSETASRSRLDDINSLDNVQVNSASPTGSLRWPLADPADGGRAPDAVAALFAGKEGGAGTNNATFRTYLGGSTDNIFSGDPNWASYNYLIRVMATKPGGGAWTNADVQGLRFEFLSTDGAPIVRTLGVYYEAAYAPSTNATVTGVRALVNVLARPGIPGIAVVGARALASVLARPGVPGIAVGGARALVNVLAKPGVVSIVISRAITGVRALVNVLARPGTVRKDKSITGVRATVSVLARPGVVTKTGNVSITGARALVNVVVRPGGLPAAAHIIGVRALVRVYASADWDCRIRYFDPTVSAEVDLDPASSSGQTLDLVSSSNVTLDPTSSSCR